MKITRNDVYVDHTEKLLLSMFKDHTFMYQHSVRMLVHRWAVTQIANDRAFKD